MKKNENKYYFLILLLSFCYLSVYCSENEQKKLIPSNKLILVNPAHLDNLYEEITVGEKQMAIIHIYCNFPEYKWVEAKGEGIACIDDASRAAIFYSRYYKITDQKVYLRKVRLLTEFILHMQADNGFFYNFIEDGYSINKTYKTSLAQPDWWTWRAIWSLTETYSLFISTDSLYAKKIYQSIGKVFSALEKNLPLKKEFKNIDGFKRPAWLMSGTGADQTSILILALINYLNIKKDPVLLSYLNDLCDGIIVMQSGDKNKFPFYAFMSWENLWHAYGNSQSYALLKAYELTHIEKYKTAALREINYFYPFLLKENFINYFSIKNDNGKIIQTERAQYSQIAYGIRPMIFASLEAAKITGKSSYSKFAGKILLWFFGKNVAGKQIYESKSGICYDGINNVVDVNKNSGAESTIEALLSISAIELDKNAFPVVQNFLRKK